MQHLGDGDTAVIQPPAIAGHAVVVRHVAHTRLMWIQSRQHGSARRTTAPGIIELREPETIGGESVEVGRGDFTAIAPDIGETHVIHQHNQYIRLRQCRRNRRLRPHQYRCRDEHSAHGGQDFPHHGNRL